MLEGDLHIDPTDAAIAQLALSVGGILLARAVDSTHFSDRILKACRTKALRDLDLK